MTAASPTVPAPAFAPRTVPVALADGFPVLVDGLIQLLPKLAPEVRVIAAADAASDLEALLEKVAPPITVVGDRIRRSQADTFWDVVARCTSRSRVIVIGGHAPGEAREAYAAELRDAAASGAAAYVPRTAHASELAAVIRAVALGYMAYPIDPGRSCLALGRARSTR